MEKADFTLANYIKESELPDESKFNILRQILHTISLVHKRGI